jgi:hypothetical protein
MSGARQREQVVKAALDQLQANATVQRQLSAFAADLETRGYRIIKRTDVRRYASSLGPEMDVRRYDSDFRLEVFVDVDTPTAARSVCWCCEVFRADGRWSIERRVVQNTSDGEDTLEEFPDIEIVSDDELEAGLEAALAQLIESPGWSRYVR